MIDNNVERQLMLEVRKQVNYTLVNCEYLQSLVGDKLDFGFIKELIKEADGLTYTDNFKSLNEVLQSISKEYNELAEKADRVIYRNIYNGLKTCEDKSHAGFQNWLDALKAEFSEKDEKVYFTENERVEAFNSFVREKYNDAFKSIFG